jgi:DNA-directed RNA polymerase specialized sigma24 family protein
MAGAVVKKTFDDFVAEVEPGLRRALVGHLPPAVVPDALSEAFAYAWENWSQMADLANPGGFLFRVAQSRIRSRRHGLLPGPDPVRLPHVEPELGPAMRALSDQQRSAVWLVHACGWSYADAGVALDISPSAVGTHVSRAMAKLREHLGVHVDE